MTAAICQLETYASDDEVLVKLGGASRLFNAEKVKTYLTSLVTNGTKALFIVVAGLNELDSAGLGVLVGIHMTCRKYKVEMALLAPTVTQLELLRSTRLDSVLRIMQGIVAQEVRQKLEQDALRVPHAPSTL